MGHYLVDSDGTGGVIGLPGGWQFVKEMPSEHSNLPFTVEFGGRLHDFLIYWYFRTFCPPLLFCYICWLTIHKNCLVSTSNIGYNKRHIHLPRNFFEIH